MRKLFNAVTIVYSSILLLLTICIYWIDYTYNNYEPVPISGWRVIIFAVIVLIHTALLFFSKNKPAHIITFIFIGPFSIIMPNIIFHIIFTCIYIFIFINLRDKRMRKVGLSVFICFLAIWYFIVVLFGTVLGWEPSYKVIDSQTYTSPDRHYIVEIEKYEHSNNNLVTNEIDVSFKPNHSIDLIVKKWEMKKYILCTFFDNESVDIHWENNNIVCINGKEYNLFGY